MRAQEGLHGLELVWDALDVIEPVDAKKNLFAIKAALKVDDLVLDQWSVQTFLKAMRLDADREGINLERVLAQQAATDLLLPPQPPPGEGHLRAEQPRARVQKVARAVAPCGSRGT